MQNGDHYTPVTKNKNGASSLMPRSDSFVDANSVQHHVHLADGRNFHHPQGFTVAEDSMYRGRPRAGKNGHFNAFT
jgi:hypothetical protein